MWKDAMVHINAFVCDVRRLIIGCSAVNEAL